MAVRRMEDGDVEAFVAMANAVGWSYESADAERLMRLFPDGCLAYDDGSLSGFATAIPFGTLGVIGNVVVESRRRRSGIGSALTKACFSRLDEAEEVRLYAYEHVVGFYERLGFRSGAGYLTMKAKAGASCRGHGAVQVDDGIARKVVSLDARASGADRSHLLKALRGEFPDLALASMDGDDVDGYLYARGSMGSGYEVGPWVASSAGGGALLDALMSRIEPGAEVWVTVPEDNPGSMEPAHRLGFEPAFRTVEMALGRAPTAQNVAILALCGLEKG